MPQITLDPKKLNAIKDTIFTKAIENELPHAIKAVLRDEVESALFRVVGQPEVLTAEDANGDVWIGNDYFKVKVNFERFLEDVADATASILTCE